MFPTFLKYPYSYHAEFCCLVSSFVISSTRMLQYTPSSYYITFLLQSAFTLTIIEGIW